MNSFMGHGVNFKVQVASKGTKKRSLAETGMNEYENDSGIDLELRLSPPGSSSGNLPNVMKSRDFQASLPSPASLGAYQPSIVNIEKNFNFDGISKDELPPLVVMGCARCLMYVMVSKAAPKCPNCKNSKLIDEFQVNPSKKLKTYSN